MPAAQIWHRRSTHRAFGGCTTDDYEEDTNWTLRLDHNWDLAAVKDVAQAVRGARGFERRGCRARGATACWLPLVPRPHTPVPSRPPVPTSLTLPAPQVMNKHNHGGQTRANWLDKGSEHPHRIALSVHVDAVKAVVAVQRDYGRRDDRKQVGQAGGVEPAAGQGWS